jgi:hypothetical protein
MSDHSRIANRAKFNRASLWPGKFVGFNVFDVEAQLVNNLISGHVILACFMLRFEYTWHIPNKNEKQSEN